MRDIGNALNMIMQTNNCSSIRAFFLYSQNEGDVNVLRELQSESSKKISGRLRNSGNIEDIK